MRHTVDPTDAPAAVQIHPRHALAPASLGMTFFGTLGFVAVCIAVGSRLLGLAARLVARTSLSQPAAMSSSAPGSGPGWAASTAPAPP